MKKSYTSISNRSNGLSSEYERIREKNGLKNKSLTRILDEYYLQTNE